MMMVTPKNKAFSFVNKKRNLQIPTTGLKLGHKFINGSPKTMTDMNSFNGASS